MCFILKNKVSLLAVLAIVIYTERVENTLYNKVISALPPFLDSGSHQLYPGAAAVQPETVGECSGCLQAPAIPGQQADWASAECFSARISLCVQGRSTVHFLMTVNQEAVPEHVSMVSGDQVSVVQCIVGLAPIG